MKQLLIGFYLLPTVFSLNILLFLLGTNQYERNTFEILAQQLALRHHEVITVKPILIPEEPRLVKPKLHLVKEKTLKNLLNRKLYEPLEKIGNKIPWQKEYSIDSHLDAYWEAHNASCYKILNSNLVDSLRKETIDVSIVYAGNPCQLAISYVLGLPTIYFDVEGTTDETLIASGTPLDLDIPASHCIVSPNAPFKRLRNAVCYLKEYIAQNDIPILSNLVSPRRQALDEIIGKMWATDYSIKKKYPNFPSMDKLKRESSLFFVNTDPILEYSRSFPPHVIPVGGIHLDFPKPLFAPWNTTIAAAKDGLIIVSMGTQVNGTAMSKVQAKAMLGALSQLKTYRIYWRIGGNVRLDGIDEADVPSHINLTAFIPQNDLLAHESCKLLITNGGVSSIMEAITYGVPMVGIPLYGMNKHNLDKAAHKGVATIVDKADLSEKSLLKAIKSVLESPKYRTKAKDMAKEIKNRGSKPLIRAIHYIEHVARHHKAAFLEHSTSNLFYTLNLDLYLAIFVVILFIFIVFKSILKLEHNRQERRNLKHHTFQVCQDDEKCASCFQPCKFFHSHDFTKCKEDSCQSPQAKRECDRSCDFLQFTYIEKPGRCPTESNSSQYECSASCHLDGDCGETSKCCTYGCNRQCTKPTFELSTSLLPVPKNLTVEERKGKRSVMVRWDMNRNISHSITTLFVIEWRWSLYPSESWTEWQTVTTRTKAYAILKHLISAGRYYQFRVAAVNSQGSLGFSAPTEPFKLSREVEAPSAPRSLSLGQVEMMNGLWNQKIQWLQPVSDLPIKSYQILWAPSPVESEEEFSEFLRKAPEPEEDGADEKPSWHINGTEELHLFAVSGLETQAQLVGLLPNQSYFAEIYAIAESENGEVQGDKSVIFLNALEKTDRKMTTETPSLHLNVPTSEDGEERQSIVIEPVHYDSGLITTASWWDSRICGPVRTKYIVQVKRGECREYEPHHHLDNNWQETRTGDCDIQLRGLSFDCDYDITISDKKNGQMIRSNFTTPSCSAIAIHSKVDCTALTTPLFCSTRRQTVICHWTKHLNDLATSSSYTIIGYRIALTSSAQSLNNITINPPNEREARFEKLKPFEVYSVEVQSITNRGFGQAASVNFVASFEHFSENEIMQFPDGQMIELPLSSSSISPHFLLFSLSFLLISIIIT
ncbi:unnamed protein product [Auanema sp. JU1783]|nr:unnamed protein product [Auanema sp. JU1783]